MQLLIEKTRLVVLALLFVSVATPICSAIKPSKERQRFLTEVISVVQKNQLLHADDLTNLTRSELRIARNAVYARHGKPFAGELSIFFSERPWYHWDSGFTEKRLTSNDRANITWIQNAERGTPFRPDNSTIEGAMRLYLDAFFQGDPESFLTLCHPKRPPRNTGYDIGTLKRLGSSILKRRDLEADFAAKGIQWTDFFGNAGGMAQYRWTVVAFPFEEWKKDGDVFRQPSQGNCIYVKWQKIEERWYIAEIAEILV